MTRPKAEPLPALLATADVMAELNVKRPTAERIMRQLPKVAFPGLRKEFVKRTDLLAFIDDSTRAA